MIREDGRSLEQLRPIRITPGVSKNATGSCLIEMGDTKVITTVTVEEGVPNFLRHTLPPQGWLTAEYSMLPGATLPRTKRERPAPSGRSQEIQRLIGRSLRSCLDLKLCLEKTFYVDCDVIQADGGTRTASINGAYVALKLAVDRMIREHKLKQNPIIDSVVAISLGLKDSNIYLDLDYQEDSSIDLDINLVLTGSGKIIEIQGTGERDSFSKEQLNSIIDLAFTATPIITDLQNIAIEGQVAEG